MEWLVTAAQWLVEFVKSLGYSGVFIMTFIESTFIPIPAEITMIPAGYLVYEGQMNGYLVMISALLGTLGGSLFNYWIAVRYGRALFVKHHKIFLMKPNQLAKIEAFFEEHGAISTFTGRLLPGLRHYISFPAGLARMKLHWFCFYTALGGGLWMLLLFTLGYYIGENEILLKKYLTYIIWGLLIGTAIMVFAYVKFTQYRQAKKLLQQ